MPPFVPTPQQQAIIDHDVTRHGRVLAGPGTGKSATIVALAQRLTSDQRRLRLLTFTRAATAELARKVGAVASEVERPSTIHSFAIATLIRNPGATSIPQPLRISDSWEESHVIRPSLSRRIGMGLRVVDKLIAEMAANWESLREEAIVEVTPTERRRFVQGWREHREIYGYTLLAELPYALMRAIEEHSDLSGLDYDVLVVDEYQDLNACDLRVLRLLANRGVSVLAVGDDDQSIYSFRKAAPEGIRRFVHEYPDPVDYPLTVTHRFGADVLEWAAYVIEADPDRIPRPRVSPADGSPPGDVKLLRFENVRDEARGIASIASLFVTAGVLASEIVVLVRSDHNRAFSEPIRAALEHAGFLVTDPDYVDELFARHHNRVAVEVLRLVANGDDSIAWASLLTLEAGVGEAFLDYVYDNAVHAGRQFGPTLLELRVAEFSDGPSSSPRAAALIDRIRMWIDQYSSLLDGSAPWPESLRSLENLPGAGFDEEALTIIDQVGQISEPGESLGRFLGQIPPLGKDIATSLAEGVRIMTMGGAKGLTVDAAIIAALEDGVIPRPGRDRSEERRLLYVAMTRARRFVYGTWARRRSGPAARAGGAGLAMRHLTPFLDEGPVISTDGRAYLRAAQA